MFNGLHLKKHIKQGLQRNSKCIKLTKVTCGIMCFKIKKKDFERRKRRILIYPESTQDKK